MKFLRHLSIVGVIAGALVMLTATASSAAPWSFGNYGHFAHEGSYPNGNHACGLSGWKQAVSAKKGKYDGRTYTIRLCYNGRYGAYARLDGAAKNDRHCTVALDRSNSAHETSKYATVYESVDGGVGYAYTKIGNDLSGRLARAALVCFPIGSTHGKSVVHTSWY